MDNHTKFIHIPPLLPLKLHRLGSLTFSLSAAGLAVAQVLAVVVALARTSTRLAFICLPGLRLSPSALAALAASTQVTNSSPAITASQAASEISFTLPVVAAVVHLFAYRIALTTCLVEASTVVLVVVVVA